MTTVDLFAGPGGWDTGVLPLGITPLGIEWDPDACATAEAAGHARAGRTVEVGRKRYREGADIAELDPRDFGGATGLITSPPCQGFSMAGKGRGRQDSEHIVSAVGDFMAGRDPRDWLAGWISDPRSVLALEPLRWTLALRPARRRRRHGRLRAEQRPMRRDLPRDRLDGARLRPAARTHESAPRPERRYLDPSVTAPACACGHDPAAHDAPAGPCHLCGPADALHPYTPEENP